jgi:hypothetical protein
MLERAASMGAYVVRGMRKTFSPVPEVASGVQRQA